MKMPCTDIKIVSFSTSSGDRLYLRITFSAKWGGAKEPATNHFELQDDVLMRVLFDVALIEGWSGTHVYYKDSHISVGDNGDIIQECKVLISEKGEFLKLLEDDHILLIAENQLAINKR